MNARTISALALLVAATIAVMSMGSSLSVLAKGPTEKYCFDRIEFGQVIQSICFGSLKECKLTQAGPDPAAHSECYKAPKPKPF